MTEKQPIWFRAVIWIAKTLVSIVTIVVVLNIETLAQAVGADDLFAKLSGNWQTVETWFEFIGGPFGWGVMLGAALYYLPVFIRWMLKLPQRRKSKAESAAVAAGKLPLLRESKEKLDALYSEAHITQKRGGNDYLIGTNNLNDFEVIREARIRSK